MRRLIMFVLLALVLPTVTWASTINFTTGTFSSGTITSNLMNPVSVQVTGMNGTVITLSNLTLVPSCTPASVTTCTFSTGSLTVSQSSSVVFTSSLSSGILKKTGPGGNIITISASLSNCGPHCTGGTVLF